MLKKFSLFFLILSFLVFSSVVYAAPKELEVTTYYPAPYGEYQTLTTTQDAYFATSSGNVGIGTNAPASKLSVSGDLDVTEDANLAVNSGNVGIGTDTPTTKLQVVGGPITATGGLRLPIGAPAAPQNGDIWIQ